MFSHFSPICNCFLHNSSDFFIISASCFISVTWNNCFSPSSLSHIISVLKVYGLLQRMVFAVPPAYNLKSLICQHTAVLHPKQFPRCLCVVHEAENMTGSVSFKTSPLQTLVNPLAFKGQRNLSFCCQQEYCLVLASCRYHLLMLLFSQDKYDFSRGYQTDKSYFHIMN